MTIVADGMGGHSGGEVASRIAIETISRVYYETDSSPEDALRRAFEQANQEINAASITDHALNGMGTTGTALAIYNNSAIVAHVGDSRLYLIRGENIYLMTEDHSAVMELVKSGDISREEARHHEDRNVILRALGTAPRVEVSMWERPLTVRKQDQFVLCSDGLSDLVNDAEIQSTVSSAGDTYTACSQLIDLAKRRGGHDNITVGVVQIVPAVSAEPTNLRETREIEVAL